MAATRIQSAYRKYLDNVHNMAATRIQSAYRMCRAYRKYIAYMLKRIEEHILKLKREQAAKRAAKRKLQQADMPPVDMPPTKRRSLCDPQLSTFRFDTGHTRKVFAALGEPQYMCSSTVHTDFNSFVTVDRFNVARAQLQNEGLDLKHIHTHTYKITNKL